MYSDETDTDLILINTGVCMCVLRTGLWIEVSGFIESSGCQHVRVRRDGGKAFEILGSHCRLSYADLEDKPRTSSAFEKNMDHIICTGKKILLWKTARSSAFKKK